jgi:hypothetical protein
VGVYGLQQDLFGLLEEMPRLYGWGGRHGGVSTCGSGLNVEVVLRSRGFVCRCALEVSLVLSVVRAVTFTHFQITTCIIFLHAVPKDCIAISYIPEIPKADMTTSQSH